LTIVVESIVFVTAASASNEPEAEEEAPRRLTFQEIVEKIEKGEEIPGIKQIPNKLNDAAPSEAKLSVRPKPWEMKKDSQPDDETVR
jgi:hypothetical protein